MCLSFIQWIVHRVEMFSVVLGHAFTTEWSITKNFAFSYQIMEGHLSLPLSSTKNTLWWNYSSDTGSERLNSLLTIRLIVYFDLL